MTKRTLEEKRAWVDGFTWGLLVGVALALYAVPWAARLIVGAPPQQAPYQAPPQNGPFLIKT